MGKCVGQMWGICTKLENLKEEEEEDDDSVLASHSNEKRNGIQSVR